MAGNTNGNNHYKIIGLKTVIGNAVLYDYGYKNEWYLKVSLNAQSREDGVGRGWRMQVCMSTCMWCKRREF